MKKVLIFWYNFMYKFTEAILCFGMGLNQMKSVLHKYPNEISFTSFFASKALTQSHYRGSKTWIPQLGFQDPNASPGIYKRFDTRWYNFERPLRSNCFTQGEWGNCETYIYAGIPLLTFYRDSVRSITFPINWLDCT